MRLLAIILATATLALAGSTAYLAHALQLERARTSQAASAARQPASGISNRIPSTVAAIVAPAQTATMQVNTPEQKLADRPRDLAVDPVRAAEIKAAFAPLMKDMMVYAGLNSLESERLLDLTAEAMLRGQQRSEECRSTPGCDIRAEQKLAQEPFRRDLETILGAEKLRRMDTYDELQKVSRFRSQMPAGQVLSETTVTRLGTALSEERYRRVDNAEPTAAFNQRMYNRAAELLTAEQLAFFKQRQDSIFGRE